MHNKNEIIKSYMLYNGIGIDICDEIMSYIIDCNSILPIENTIKFIRDETDDNVCIKIFQGCNSLVKYNILLDEINFVSKENILFVNLKVLICSLLIIKIYTNKCNIYNNIISLKKPKIMLIDIKVDLDNIKLKYELTNIIKKIYKNLSSKKCIFPNFIKKDIRNKLDNLEHKTNYMYLIEVNLQFK